jgi:hypothetical protein
MKGNLKIQGGENKSAVPNMDNAVTNSLKIQDSNTNFKLQTDVVSSPSHITQLGTMFIGVEIK